MNIGDLLKNFVIDVWYKAFVYLGVITIVLSLFFETKAVTNQNAFLLGLALLFFGIGEWKNHKVIVEHKPANILTGPAAIIQYPIRKPDLFGTLLNIFGIILLIIFMFRVIFPSGQPVGN